MCIFELYRINVCVIKISWISQLKHLKHKIEDNVSLKALIIKDYHRSNKLVSIFLANIDNEIL